MKKKTIIKIILITFTVYFMIGLYFYKLPSIVQVKEKNDNTQIKNPNEDAVSKNIRDNIVFCSESSPDVLSPAIAANASSFDAAGNTIYSQLIYYDNKTLKSTLNMLDNYTISDDTTEINLYLKKGIKFQTTKFFHPSRNFNADDVVFSISRMIDEKNPYYQVSGGNYMHAESLELKKLIKEVKKIDDYHVKINLNEPSYLVFPSLGMKFMSIYSAEYAGQLLANNTPEKIDTQPVGTGPYILNSYRPNAQITYISNPDYFNSTPPTKKLTFAITPHSATRYLKLKSKECDVIALPEPRVWTDLMDDKQVKFSKIPALSLGYVSFNNEREFFKDINNRKIVATLIDVDQIQKNVFESFGDKLFLPAPNSLVKNQVNKIPEKNKPNLNINFNGKTLNFIIPNIERAYLPNARKIAEIIQSNLKVVGIKVNIITLEWGEYLQTLRSGNFDMGFHGWGVSIPDIDGFYYPLLSCKQFGRSNTSRYCNQKVDYLLEKARKISDNNLRNKYYTEISEIFIEQQPFKPLIAPDFVIATSKNVENMPITPLIEHDFSKVIVRNQ